MNETFGQRLQRLRQEAGMSQPQLAAAASIPIGTLRNLEQDRRVPRLDTADALARAIGVSLDTLADDVFQSGTTAEASEPEPPKPRGRPRKVDAAADADQVEGKAAPAKKKGKRKK